MSKKKKIILLTSILLIYCENKTAREAMMVKNFQDFYEKLPKGKYYGQLV